MHQKELEYPPIITYVYRIMNKMNKKKGEVLPMSMTWEAASKILIVLLQSDNPSNHHYAKEQIIQMGINLDKLEKAAKEVVS
tara:strand:- start:511 stop:756 length:246 start_codon:yes stop_codon:yes gene_type:complete